MTDTHIQHTWTLAHDNGDQIIIDLWTDGYSVRVDGGPDDGDEDDRGQQAIDQLLAKYQTAGYQLVRDYAVNDPQPHDEPVEDDDDAEPDGRPDECPECGSPVAYDPRYSDDFREGAAWLCTGCKWGRWITA
jgi:hypothetical protein